ncbi:MAG TPA: hypothetical protein VKH64_11915 [Candidatus Binatia bacterium]|nr:hypothetical protein [Candidatus Binatia bacterium]
MIKHSASKAPLYALCQVVPVLGLVALLSSCGDGPLVINFSGGGSSPGRFYNATRAMDTTLNMADAADAGCTGARAAQGDAAAAQARAAAANLQAAMDMFNDTPQAYTAVAEAMKAAAQASRFAYYVAMSCGAVPPDVPNIPNYTEEFWDVSSP